MNQSRESGIALILTLILIAVISTMAVSLLFVSQSETWSTMNYRLMSQARDGAEAGLNSAVNFILNNNATYPYVAPDVAANTPNDPITNYTLTSYPVQYNNNNVVLSARSDVTSNYQYSTAQSNFNTNGVGKGTISAGATTVNYSASATLLSMRQVTPYGSTTPQTVQTWLIDATGTINAGVRNAQVDVSAILERPITPTFGYAAFGASANCNALDLSGVGHTDSYDSTVGPATSNFAGNVGTNGNLTTLGSGTVNGSLSTPRTGVGSCGAGGTITAYQGNMSQLTQGIDELPQQITYPPPALPSPMPPLTNQSPGPTCGAVAGCTDIHHQEISLAPGNYGNLSVNSNTDAHLSAGTYNLNSVVLNGGSTIIIDSGPVIFNITGCATLNGGNTDCATYLATAADFTGGNISNAGLNPRQLQIQYAGTGAINLRGGAQSSALVFAPRASVTLGGGGDFYGSIIGYTVAVSGNGALHYDRNLQNTAFMIGNYMLQSFTWNKY